VHDRRGVRRDADAGDDLLRVPHLIAARAGRLPPAPGGIGTTLADYTARRDAEFEQQRQALSRWARRRADPAADALAYDDERLLVCDLCTIATPAATDDADQWWSTDDDGAECSSAVPGT
jgi:hypothetical protein